MPRPPAGGPPAVCCQLSHLRKRRIGLVEVALCLTAVRALPYSTSARVPHRAEMLRTKIPSVVPVFIAVTPQVRASQCGPLRGLQLPPQLSLLPTHLALILAEVLLTSDFQGSPG